MSTTYQQLKVGSKVDSLRIERVLGQGSFGITYLVVDELIGRKFALKEYYPAKLVSRADDGVLHALDIESEGKFSSGLSLFIAEGRTVAPLEHPNIVKVFRCFEANGTAYLLMPYYHGEPLHRLLERGGLFSAEETEALTWPLLDALEYLHENGVIHQDIKPANIYVTEKGDPILLDFGAALDKSGERNYSSGKLGSQGYAALEQFQADGKIGPWTDIYGLSASLYRVITGLVPVSATQRETAIEQRQPDPLEPPGEHAGQQQHPEFLAGIRLGLQLRPANRPKNVSEWSRTFERGETTGRVIESSMPKEGREWLPLVLLGVFLVALLAVSIFLLTDDTVTPVGETEEPTIAPSQSSQATSQQVSEDQRWMETLDADTSYAYQRFLQDFPTSVYRDEALKLMGQLDDVVWSAADAEGIKLSYLAYLDEFPAGRHEPEAMIRLDVLKRTEAEGERQRIQRDQNDQLAWNQTRITRTLPSVDQYLENFPGGLFDEEARQLRRTLVDESKDTGAYEAAQKLNKIDAYQAYIDAFPRGKHVADALMEIDNLTLNVGKIFRDCVQCPRMVVLPAGSFWQGADQDSPAALANEKPRHQVVFSSPFAMSINEISFKQWDSCVEEGFCTAKPGDNHWGRDSRPVIMVSWNDAQEYINWINQKTDGQYRLPSESEWEYAARAGETEEWPGGDSSLVCESGNIAGTETGLKWQHPDCSDNFSLQTAPAGSFRPNAFGLSDMSGNVAEWTLDCMNLTYIDAPSDGSAWNRGMCSSHMTRGGSWFTGSRESRLSSRFNLKAGDRNDFTGFRIVRSVEQ